MNLKRVVVTGIGAITPLGNSAPIMWDALLKGVSAAAPISSFDASLFKTRIACEIKNYNPLDFFDRKEVKKLDLFSQYGIIAASEAVLDAALDDVNVNKDAVGVIWGVGMGGTKTFQDSCHDFFNDGCLPRFSPFFIPKTILDICAGHISIKFGFRGPNFATAAACASSAAAISAAFDIVRLGKCSAVVTGGSEFSVCETAIGGFSSMQALSTRNDDPASASRPFDRDRDGFVMGEGGAALILEDLDHARARGAKIYAEMTGSGLSADAFHITSPHPQGNGALVAMRQAVLDSGMCLSDVDHINTHGTSTPVGDVSEAKAIDLLFGSDASKISLNATKSMMGHLMGAAGAAEAIATVLAVKNDVVPPTINHFNDDPDIPPLDFTFNAPTHRTVNFALSNAFGFGGHNVSLAFRKFIG